MKTMKTLLVLILSLLLSGCGWLEGNYVSVTPHKTQRPNTQPDVIYAENYVGLKQALEDIIAAGTEIAAINVTDYPGSSVETGMAMAVKHAKNNYPIGAYAVEKIDYELGTSNGAPAVSVNITYRHAKSEIQQIRNAKDIARADKMVAAALEGYQSSIVMHIEQYEPKDYTQFVQDHGVQNPNLVMEIPQVTETVYGIGEDRVVELIFTYQTSRDALRRMQSEVQPIFDSAALYVRGDAEDRQKFSQLYSFLMERFDYQLDTSITPAYSLLCHGVGDSRAFATVYAAMCRNAGLECVTVTGTHDGEPWTWNIVLDGGQYFHVDLLRSNLSGWYQEFTDGEMEGYVWDYSAYPACNGRRVQPTDPAEEGE